jgi:hypothetical protein
MREHLTRLSKKSNFSVFMEKCFFKIKELWTLVFSISGFFDSLNKRMQVTANSVRSVRRESGMEECGNTSGIQVLDEPLELSVVDHSTA